MSNGTGLFEPPRGLALQLEQVAKERDLLVKRVNTLDAMVKRRDDALRGSRGNGIFWQGKYAIVKAENNALRRKVAAHKKGIEKLIVAICRLPHGADLPLPNYATVGSAGLDLYAAMPFPFHLEPGDQRLIPTGISVAVPDGWEAQIRPRSGLAVKHGVTIANSPGTIDSDYRGEVSVCLVNHSGYNVLIDRGDRIAQMLFFPTYRVEWKEVEALDETVRGTGGYGSTGR